MKCILMKSNFNNYKNIQLSLFFFFLCLCCSFLSTVHSTSYWNVVTDEEISEDYLASKIELYLQKEVPGLAVSYRTVINEFIKEGNEIYLYGGMVRDLVDCTGNLPNDIDFIFFGKLDDLFNTLSKNGWPYVIKEIKAGVTITIGDSKSTHAMQGISAVHAELDDINALDFACNSIFYNCRSCEFIPKYKHFIEDAINKVIQPTSEDWIQWLYSNKRRHIKIFRTWKMMGKGYHCSLEFKRFIKDEVLGMVQPELELFEQDLFRYLHREFEYFDDIADAASEVMGDVWTHLHIHSLRQQAEGGDRI